jgi:mono/diheme cytochrome c family protein
MLCHSKLAGSSLGPETRQLNRMLGGENLLDKFEALGLFDAPLPKPYLAPLPTPYEGPEGRPPAGATNEDLARSYLHGNCASCHRPEDPSLPVLDLRYGVPMDRMNLCNAAPQKGGAGLGVYTLLTPGKPEESVLWARVGTLNDQDRMPQIATYVVDEPGLKLITDWITSIQSCP